MRLKDAVLKATEILKNGGVGTPRLDAEIIMEKILSVDRIFLIVHPDHELSEAEERRFFEGVEERSGGRPVAYFVGEKEFMGLTFEVSEAVLIPRPDTEIAVEEALHTFSDCPEMGLKILDLCTGSGAIAVSLAHYLKNAEVTATDISREALDIAGRNAERNEVSVRFLQGDLFEALPEGEVFDLIISNPPYIPSGEINNLEKNVKDFEPRLALDGGESGLEFYRRIVPEAVKFLKPGGVLILEIGSDQANDLHLVCEEAGGYETCAIYPDLAGLDRVVKVRKKAI